MTDTEKKKLLSWHEEFGEFRKKTDAFYAGQLDKGAYKAFSGRFGSYAQRGGEANMLRLRMTAGRLTKEKLDFVADVIERYRVKRVHFTTCQTIQLHDIDGKTAADIMAEALDAGIVTLGGGGDYPRNVMCSPLSGTQKDEYFDTLPWAEAAGDYLLGFIDAPAMPRKLKVAFSNSPANLTHATFRDLGFAARPDGSFDVYSAGGLGPNPRMGILSAKAVDPSQILYHIKAMWLLFLAHGNYSSRVRARTRYMPEALGGTEAYVAAYRAKLEEVFASGEDLTLSLAPRRIDKSGDSSRLTEGFRVLSQKQEGLYSILYHPIGGQPRPEWFSEIRKVIKDMKGAELRLTPDGGVYLINLTAGEAEKVLDATRDGAKTPFEASVSCIGSSTCQVGIGDSQRLLAACVGAVRAAGISADALPQIHISGCPSSCSAHQIGNIGFMGTVKMVEQKPHPAFFLQTGGREGRSDARFASQVGPLPEKDIPDFLVSLGKEVDRSGLGFDRWYEQNPEGILRLAKPYLA